MSQPTTSETSRHLPLDGAYNVRDVGGYRTRDGRWTRWRTFFRADSLHRLTPEAQATLCDYGVRSVLDLRRSDELEMAPNVFANAPEVTYHHISLLRDERPVPGKVRSLVDTYRRILDQRQEQVRTTLEVLSTPDGLPGLVHCSAGKDRTGVITALMLGLVGVPHETIVADYALTTTYMQGPLLDEIRQRALKRGFTWEQYEPLVQSPPAFMEQTLQHIDERYGGIDAYVRAIGLQSEQIDRLQRRLLV